MDYQFRPFGVGVVMSSEEMADLKKKGEEVVSAVKEQSKNVLFVSIGLAWLAAEVATRHSANAVTAVANELADLHDVCAAKQHAHGYFPDSMMKVPSTDLYRVAQESLEVK